MSIPAVDLSKLEADFSVLDRLNSPYNYGGKAPDLMCEPRVIVAHGGVDCSGYVRWALARATNHALIIPDGSQAQREWAEGAGLHQLDHYSDVRYGDVSRLFICFIKPYTNGCGDVGHVWFCRRLEPQAESTTMESHGGGGCTSRKWNYRTLVREAYSAYELPTK